jgi:integrase/recombinase XerC
LNRNGQSLSLSAADLLKQCEHFIRSLKENRPETRGTYQRALRQFLRWFRSDRSFRFRVKDVERFKKYLLRKKQLSDVSVATYLTALRRLCEYLVTLGVLKENPAKQIEGSKRPMTHSRAPLGYADVEKLLSSIDRSSPRGIRDYAMIKTMLGCGLSEIEMIRANIGDLQKENGQHVIYVQGKGHNAKDETVLVPEDVNTAIDNYLEQREKTMPEQPLFVSAGNKVHGKRMTTRGVRERVNYYLKRSGIKNNHSQAITPYSLRHTAALMLVDAGVTAEELQKRMRLGSIATAMIYMNQRRSRSEVKR